ncbi:hypothetical protein SBADM41S_10009 [Streptomyces badius]
MREGGGPSRHRRCEEARRGLARRELPRVIREIRGAVPADKPVSATVGDVPYKPGTVAQAALGAAVSGATYIKVGLYGCTTPTRPSR